MRETIKNAHFPHQFHGKHLVSIKEKFSRDQSLEFLGFATLTFRGLFSGGFPPPFLLLEM